MSDTSPITGVSSPTDWISVVVLAATGIILLAALGVAWRNHRAEFRPYLTAQFVFYSPILYVEIKNLGRVAATNVTATFDPALTGSLVKNGLRACWTIEYLAPNESRYCQILGIRDLTSESVLRHRVSLAYDRDSAFGMRWCCSRPRRYVHKETIDFLERLGDPIRVGPKFEKQLEQLIKAMVQELSSSGQ